MILPEVTDIRRWTPQAGDRLIVHVDQLMIRPEEAAHIKGMVRSHLGLPDDFPVLVLTAGMSVEVAAP